MRNKFNILVYYNSYPYTNNCIWHTQYYYTRSRRIDGQKFGIQIYKDEKK